jgi:hypothetical protein
MIEKIIDISGFTGYNIILIFFIIIFLYKNVTFIKILIVYISFVILQIFTIYKNTNNKSNTISYNNLDEIKKTIKEELKKRTDLLNENKMNYDEWLNYNIKNNIINVGKYKFYFFIFKYIDKNNFLTLSHANKDYIGLVWSDVMKDQKENFPFIKEETDDKLINNMYELGQFNKINSIKYYWTDPIERTLIKKESFFYKWYDKANKKSGVIGIGYNTNNVLESNKMDYSDNIHFMSVIYVDAIILIVTYITYLLNNNKLKSIIFLILTSSYVISYLNSKELMSSFSEEHLKIQSIDSSVLGISFLIGVNIFILTSLKKEFKKKLFIESGFIFSISLILLLLSMLKITNYMYITELMRDRISTQLTFNFSIILNIFIIINYITHVIAMEKMHY